MAAEDASTGGGLDDPSLWQEGYDEATGRLYYFHHGTSQSQFEEPECLKGLPHQLYHDPSGPSWHAYVDSDQYLYYYNHDTGESQYEAPTEAFVPLRSGLETSSSTGGPGADTTTAADATAPSALDAASTAHEAAAGVDTGVGGRGTAGGDEVGAGGGTGLHDTAFAHTSSPRRASGQLPEPAVGPSGGGARAGKEEERRKRRRDRKRRKRRDRGGQADTGPGAEHPDAGSSAVPAAEDGGRKARRGGRRPPTDDMLLLPEEEVKDSLEVPEDASLLRAASSAQDAPAGTRDSDSDSSWLDSDDDGRPDPMLCGMDSSGRLPRFFRYQTVCHTSVCEAPALVLEAALKGFAYLLGGIVALLLSVWKPHLRARVPMWLRESVICLCSIPSLCIPGLLAFTVYRDLAPVDDWNMRPLPTLVGDVDPRRFYIIRAGTGSLAENVAIRFTPSEYDMDGIWGRHLAPTPRLAEATARARRHLGAEAELHGSGMGLPQIDIGSGSFALSVASLSDLEDEPKSPSDVLKRTTSRERRRSLAPSLSSIADQDVEAEGDVEAEAETEPEAEEWDTAATAGGVVADVAVEAVHVTLEPTESLL